MSLDTPENILLRYMRQIEGKCIKILLLISHEYCLNRLHFTEKRNIRRILHYDEILVHFCRNWLHYDEKGVLHAEIFALFLE